MHDDGMHATPSGGTRWSVRRGLLVFAVVVVLEVVVVLAVAAWALAGARSDLVAARAHASDGRATAAELDLDAAQASFAQASSEFDSASAQLGNPAVRVLTVAPVIGRNLRSVEALSVAGGMVAEAAANLVDVINSQPDGLGSYLPSDGRFPVDRLAELADVAESSELQLADAVATVDASPDDRLMGVVADARRQFDDELGEAQNLVASTAQASRALAAFLGADGPRRYLFGAQNPAELRGTGGYIGAYAVATFDRGTFDLTRFKPIQRLTSLPISDIPPPNADYAARYNRYGGAGFWQAINATPDFPSAAQAMVRLYEQTEDTELDGAMVVDPFALEALLRLTGDVRVPGVGRVDADNAVAVVSNAAYDEFTSSADRKEVLGDVAGTALRRLLDSGASVGPGELLNTLVPMAGGRHLLLYSTDPEVQQALRDAGLAGALPEPTSDTVAVSVNNAAVNKVDFFVDRVVDYRVALRADGSATAQLTVTFDNSAPSGDPSYVLGPQVDGLQAGDNLSLVSVFCGRCKPTGADPPIRAKNPRKGTVIEQELGHTVATTLMAVPSGTRRSVELSWELDQAWSPDGDGCYSLDYVPQPSIRPTTLRVDVTPPDGYTARTEDDATRRGTLHDGPVGSDLTMDSCYVASDSAY